MNKVIIFTDGSAEIRTMKGGCGAYILMNGSEYYLSKGYKPTKTGRMELMAILNSLRFVEDKTKELIFYCDSKYAIKSCSVWLEGWKRRSFEGIKNVDILKQLDVELSKFKTPPFFYHVKGHQEDNSFKSKGNNIADLLCHYKNFSEYQEDLKNK